MSKSRMKWIELPLLWLGLVAVGSVAIIRIHGHTWPIIRVAHMAVAHLKAPGVTRDGITICPNGCYWGEDLAQPATINGERVDQMGIFTDLRKCTQVTMLTDVERYSEGSEILYDSCREKR